jgi:hypothetical protein
MLMDNIGVSLDIYIIIVIAIGTIILSAKSVKLGLSMTLLLYAGAYSLFRVLGLPSTYALYAILLALVLMTLSLYTTRGETIV